MTLYNIKPFVNIHKNNVLSPYIYRTEIDRGFVTKVQYITEQSQSYGSVKHLLHINIYLIYDILITLPQKACTMLNAEYMMQLTPNHCTLVINCTIATY